MVTSSENSQGPLAGGSSAAAPSAGIDAEGCARRHFRFGWWALLCFLSLGIVLESLHGFKVGWYLDVGNETRRHMWTLAHAHGVLLALVNLGFAATLRGVGDFDSRARHRASPCFIAACVLMPAGFFLGGIVTYGGDPGPGILLLPIGAGLLVVAVLVTALAATRSVRARDAD